MSHDNLRPGVPIRLRRDTAANWATDNPVLKLGETGWVSDSTPVRVKFGDGVTAWNDLPYAIDAGVVTQGQFVSTDGSYGLPVPTGVGGEFIITNDVLEDITFDGNVL